jgi:hypothetical protein
LLLPFPYAPLRSSKVAIVGFASETMGLAPYEDPDCEIWILNMLHGHVPRWDRLWELHDRATIEQETLELKRAMDHLGVLKAETTRPIYMVEVQPDIPMSQRHNLEYLVAHFSMLCEKLRDQPYFQSTFAFMIATAVLGIVARRQHPDIPEPGEEIYICGVEMLNGEEYAYQRSNAEFLVGYALGHGIHVHIPPRSALLASDGIYGYANGESLELLSRMRAYYDDRRKNLIAKRDAAGVKRDQAKAEWNTYDGCIQTMEWALNHLTYLCRGGKV